jgi:hypothetical protein
MTFSKDCYVELAINLKIIELKQIQVLLCIQLRALIDWLTEATDTVPKGSSGWGVRFLDQLIRQNK